MRTNDETYAIICYISTVYSVQYTLLDNGCVEGLAFGILAVILLTTLFVLCLVYYRHRSVVVVLFFSRVISRSCYKHGLPQAWATGALAPPPLEMLKSGLFAANVV